MCSLENALFNMTSAHLVEKIEISNLIAILKHSNVLCLLLPPQITLSMIAGKKYGSYLFTGEKVESSQALQYSGSIITSCSFSQRKKNSVEEIAVIM